MFKVISMLAGAVFLLQGCAGMSSNKSKSADVTSSPTGAMVYAGALELGETPLKHNLYDAFPAGWQNSIYQAQGILLIKKEGCKDFTMKVSDLILSKPIHADLKCSVVTKADKPAVAVPAAAKSETKPVTKLGAKPVPKSKTEKRLAELEALFKKQIITKEEYKMTRMRILNEL